MGNLKEYMREKKLIDRWTIFKAGLLGAFCGVILATGFYLIAISP